MDPVVRELPELLIAAWLVGLLGGVHCLAMCGGLASALTLGLDPGIRRDPARSLAFQTVWNLARVAGYGLAGALAGGLGAALLQFDAWHLMQRGLQVLAGLAMILLGLHLGGWWRALGWVERLGLRLWRRIEPLGRRLMPVRTLPQAAALGLLWSALPCGLVYSVLILALSSGGPGSGALTLLAFGLGTLPNLLGIGLLAGAAARLLERAWVAQAAGGLVLAFGVLALWRLV